MKKGILSIIILLILTTTVSAFGPYGYDKSKFRAVYRVFNPVTGEHLYTGTFGEAVKLESYQGWRIESCGWYTDTEAGDVVCRMYNYIIDDHLYTKDINEINNLVSSNSGWIAEGPCFESGGLGTMPVYRLYQPSTGRHLLTADTNEYNTLPQLGWRQEGIVLYGLPEPLY